ncbi:MAG: hypothetical protein M1820_005168 [Bogoriella megaspora]|nr:MAG: hypothetical protein M1820_005168 [Bogoriella megaspora]
MGEVDIAIVGCVEQLISEKEWYYVRGEADDLFTWHKSRTARGNTVAYLGCKMSLWGDISGYLVRALQEMSKAKCILYIGKTGTLSPDHTPNQTLATGDASCMNGALIKWSNPLKPFIPYSDAIREGVHTTVSSPLVESQAWVEEWQPKCTWVDCEVGHMADAARERGTSFGYLHIVSDRVTDWYPQDLTNEHSLEVTEQRGILFAEIRKVIDRSTAPFNSPGRSALSPNDEAAVPASGTVPTVAALFPAVAIVI